MQPAPRLVRFWTPHHATSTPCCVTRVQNWTSPNTDRTHPPSVKVNVRRANKQTSWSQLPEEGSRKRWDSFVQAVSRPRHVLPYLAHLHERSVHIEVTPASEICLQLDKKELAVSKTSRKMKNQAQSAPRTRVRCFALNTERSCIRQLNRTKLPDETLNSVTAHESRQELNVKQEKNDRETFNRFSRKTKSICKFNDEAPKLRIEDESLSPHLKYQKLTVQTHFCFVQ